MTDKHKDLRDALDADSLGDKWICAHYSPKTLGVGINGGPALFMVREGSYTDIEDVREIVRNLLTVRREARTLLAERDELERSLTLSGKVNKRLMDELAVVVAERDALRDALWVATEHNALHFGESHNTVIQGRAALSQEKP